MESTRKFLFGILLVACLSWSAQAQVNCTSTGAGRFPDPSDDTCQNYTLCIYISTTASYVSYNYVCPTTSVFNPTSAQCTDPSNYVCNVTTTNITTSVCTADGYIADPSSSNCSSYIECVQINGTFTETPYTCPADTFFNPNTTLCDSTYNCTVTTEEFSCTAAGRFADSTDASCQTYYLCVLATDGTYIGYTYTCPSTSVFSPSTRLCTDPANYACTN